MCKIKKITVLILLLVILAYTGYASYNNNWRDKVSPILLERLQNNKNDFFLIYLNKQTILEDRNLEKNKKAQLAYEQLIKENYYSQDEIVNILIRQNYSYKRYYLVNCVLVYGDIKIVSILADRRDVAYISYDSPVFDNSILDDTQEQLNSNIITWGIKSIKADSVWNLGFTGQNVVIGGQDTGYDWTHPALKTKYRGYINDNEAQHSYSWHDAIHEISLLHNDSIIDPSNNPCGLDIIVPCDDQNHGTHTMGTMLGSTDSLSIGVSPDSKWIGCRNMERGWGKPSTYIECFEWFLAPTDINGINPDPTKAPDVINNSWGCPLIEGCDPTNWEYMELALNNLRASGVFIVVSAGNDGIRNCGSVNDPPAMFERSFSVGALRQFLDTLSNNYIDTIASFSSRGPVIVDNSYRLKPDISAPGQGVLSCIPYNRYQYSSGTSMAGPHVAGVVALILSANPELKGNTDLIEEILINSAVQKWNSDTCRNEPEPVYPNSIYGYGKLNALYAINEAIKYNSEKNINKESALITIFPNPVLNELNIISELDLVNYNLSVYSQIGKLILKQKYNNQPISTTQLLSGIYYIRLEKGGNVISKKMIKM